MVTGRNPGGHGLAANTLVVRAFDPDHAVPALERELALIGQKTGQVLLAPTLAQILSRHGQEYIAIGVGTSGNAYLHNPTAEHSGGATIHPQFTLPSNLKEELMARFGPWPPEALPNSPRMAHAVRIMTEYILPERMPAVSLIWSSEPDKSQHASGVGSELANTAIKAADEQFGRLLRWLKKTGRDAETDIIVVSDHGYSTIMRPINLEAFIRQAGFPPGGQPGGVVVAPNGGSALLYFQDRDRATAERLARWLMGQPWCGTLTVSQAVVDIPGTLPAWRVGNEGPRAPEITLSFQWNSSLNEAGYHGYSYSTGGAPGVGQHGSMSKHELRNVLFATGPGFKQGVKLDTPSGNIDLSPTVLRLLGISGEATMEGRVLEEALVNGPDANAVKWSTHRYEAEHWLGNSVYRQQITVSRVGNTTYVDEGNGNLGTR
jgi:arylsulfatase A-like enzyme